MFKRRPGDPAKASRLRAKLRNNEPITDFDREWLTWYESLPGKRGRRAESYPGQEQTSAPQSESPTLPEPNPNPGNDSAGPALLAPITTEEQPPDTVSEARPEESVFEAEPSVSAKVNGGRPQIVVDFSEPQAPPQQAAPTPPPQPAPSPPMQPTIESGPRMGPVKQVPTHATAKCSDPECFRCYGGGQRRICPVTGEAYYSRPTERAAKTYAGAWLGIVRVTAGLFMQEKELPKPTNEEKAELAKGMRELVWRRAGVLAVVDDIVQVAGVTAEYTIRSIAEAKPKEPEKKPNGSTAVAKPPASGEPPPAS